MHKRQKVTKFKCLFYYIIHHHLHHAYMPYNILQQIFSRNKIVQNHFNKHFPFHSPHHNSHGFALNPHMISLISLLILTDSHIYSHTHMNLTLIWCYKKRMRWEWDTITITTKIISKALLNRSLTKSFFTLKKLWEILNRVIFFNHLSLSHHP